MPLVLDKQQELFIRAYNEHKKALNSYALFKVSNQSIGEDLVQDAFMKTWWYLTKGGKIDTMKAFLYRTLNNLIVDEYRKRKNKTTSLDVLFENGFEPGTNETENILDKLDGRNALLLIKSLPKRYQKVMNMKYVKQLSIGEISNITGQSKNAITVQTHRGLERLKTLYISL